MFFFRSFEQRERVTLVNLLAQLCFINQNGLSIVKLDQSWSFNVLIGQLTGLADDNGLLNSREVSISVSCVLNRFQNEAEEVANVIEKELLFSVRMRV